MGVPRLSGHTRGIGKRPITDRQDESQGAAAATILCRGYSAGGREWCVETWHDRYCARLRGEAQSGGIRNGGLESGVRSENLVAKQKRRGGWAALAFSSPRMPGSAFTAQLS